MKKFIILTFSLFLFLQNTFSQAPTPEERAVQVSATTQVSPPQIALNWLADPSATKYLIHRKGLNDTDWGSPIAQLSGSATSYVDNNVQVGIGYEYALFKEDFSPRVDVVCFSAGMEIEFTVFDAFGIGLCCSFGQGYYEVKNCGNVVAFGDDFGNSESNIFTVCDDGNGCSDITVTIKPDMIENSNYWTMKDVQTGQQIANGGSPNAFIRPRPEYGFIYAGINLPAIEDRGRILLVIENELKNPLLNELEELRTDLIKDGWRVSRRYVDKNDSPTSVQNVIKNVYAQQNDLKSVFLLGNIPTAFSGSMYPDTHVENEGAYPTDVFYGEMNGTWTDQTVNTTAPYLSIYHNVPGDGRFDQNFPPSGKVELQVGRVDLSDMSVFSDPEIELIRKYLAKDHSFKIKAFDPQRRGLVDDNFEKSIAAPAASGYRNFAAMFGTNNVVDADYFSTMSSQSYLWSYGCGSGDANTASGVGTSTDFANGNLQNVFTMLFGSQFGNWEFSNSLLRAPLGSGQTLTSCWAGNPPWALHHMAMGHNIGYSLLETQNNTNDEYLPAGPALVHTALMGDPSLRLHTVSIPNNLTISSNSNSVDLNWSTPSESSIVGYHIYRASSLEGTFTRINNNPITGTSFSDNAPLNGKNIYQVKTIKLETSGSGTYYNLSLGALDSLNFTSTGGGDTTPPTTNLSTSSNIVSTPFVVNVSFSENINGLQTSDFQVVNGVVSDLNGSGSSFSFTISPLVTGTVSAFLKSQSVIDQAGNSNVAASNTLTINYSDNPTGGCNDPSNLALNKNASQLNTQQNASASRAVDGNKNGDFWDEQSVSLTNWTNQPWWEVDLGSEADIQEIKIWNRTDCCSSVLSNYQILISNNPFTSDDLSVVLAQNGVDNYLQNGVAGSPSSIPISSTGRYVRIQLVGQGFLALTEVEVMGCSTGGGTGIDQTINFPALPNRSSTDAPFLINATASSGLPVSFSIVSGPGTISGNTITLNGTAGTITVVADQLGNNEYNAAPQIFQSFTVSSQSTGQCTAIENIAIGKSTVQSSTQFNGVADRAVDGNRNGNFWSDNSTTLTEWFIDQWWEVDLGAVAEIQTIGIWNRTDCCTETLSNFYVLVSDVPFTSNDLQQTISQQGVSNYFQLNVAARPTEISIGRTGRYVRIQKDGISFLALSEVEVFGCFDAAPCPPQGTSCNDGDPNTTNDVEDGSCNCAGTPVTNECDAVTNVALNKTVAQVSTLSAAGITGSASKAIDGNTNGIFFTSPPSASSVSASQFQAEAWWEVDLGIEHLIEEIKIYNRTDGQDRTQDCYVMVSNTPFANDLSTARSQAVYEGFLSGLIGSPSVLTPDLSGRYVRVQQQNSGYLVLGEVEVMGCLSNFSNNGNTSLSSSSSEYLHFEARKDGRKVQLRWVTNMEEKNESFILERSSDGVHFEYLMNIGSKNNSFDPAHYVENDNAPIKGKNYYRLLQTLKDGSEIYSPIHEVNFEIDLEEFVVFPNPAKERVFINMKNFLGQSGIIQIYDPRGILQLERKLDPIEDDLLEIELQNSNNGFYLVSIKVEGRKRIVRKIIIESGY